MDELALLRDFRLEDAVGDGAREHARATLRAAMTRRSRFPRRRYAVALAFAAAAVLAATAYAIVHQFVIGSTPPKSVQDQIGMRVAVATLGHAIPLKGSGPFKPAGPPVIGAAAQTPEGRVFMVMLNARDGGGCQILWWADKHGPRGEPITSGSCGFGKPVHARTFGYAYEYDGALAHPYYLLQGYAPGAVRVRIGKRFFKTPFGWFVAVYRGPEVLTAWGAHGRVVARVRLHTPAEQSAISKSPPTTKPAAQPEPGVQRHVFVSRPVGWAQVNVHVTPAGRRFTWIKTRHEVQVSMRPSTTHGVCIYVDADPGRLLDPICLSTARNEIHAIPGGVGWTMSRHRASWAEAESIVGAAGKNVARVDVRFSDGRTAPAQLYKGAIFYLIPRANYAPGHRPAELVGRDAHGRIVARMRLWYTR
jgi:hypothetical protein